MIAGIDIGEFILWGVLAIVVIAAVVSLASKLGVAGPLLLVAVGMATSLLPFASHFMLDPEWILEGLLPPLLYAAAVSLPAMEFRRDIRVIGGLSVLLVVMSSLVLGLFFWAFAPGVSLAMGIAVGAVLSPTDAVATSIVKKLGISPRVVTVLEGESLLNDATALVLLRTAIAATAGVFSLWGSVGNFAWSVLVAVGIGSAVGFANLWLRARISSTPAATAMGLVVPFLAFFPTEELKGSGLVAAVVAGIVTGQGSIKHFTAEQRLSDRVNWQTVELILEGAVFLIMGLEVTSIVRASTSGLGSLSTAALLALGAFGIIILMRALYVAPLIGFQARRAKRRQHVRPWFDKVSDRVENTPTEQLQIEFGERRASPANVGRIRSRLRRRIAAMDYFDASPLGWREGTIIVWAGMRGAVTLAAAQTLPHDHPSRELLILTAFMVATGTLALQGSTIGWLTKRLGLAGAEGKESQTLQREQLREMLREASLEELDSPALHRPDGEPFHPDLIEGARARLSAPEGEDDASWYTEYQELRLLILVTQRKALAKARSDETFGTAALRYELDRIDAEELGIRTRLHKE